MKLDILYEDEAMLVCVKPCGVPAQRDKSNDEDMLTLLKNYIFDNSKSDEEPYLAAVHRLDRPVGGVMVFARTPEAAAKLSAQVSDGTMVKFYQAIITGELPDEEGELVDFLAHDPKTNKTVIANKGDKGAKKAVLYYEVLDVMETDDGILSYVLIELGTGRHHQIRAQLASRGCGIWGDTKYNPKFAKTKRIYREIGLHSSRIELEHPVTGEHMVFKNEPVGGAFDVIELDEF
ncbi:MAG: RluA family pseudouridine synthase [Lachnospiraceae bacterium]|nr:RluA family pseudouridine synthase [Lachnospiraceae bacterium]